MAPPVLRAPEPPTEELLAAFHAVRIQQHVPDTFPPEVEAAAAEAATRAAGADRVDRRDVAFVTLDPPGSLDLDQAVAISRRDGGGWHVQYAIADVAAFVDAGDPIDVEARARGVTLYSPDLRTPLHPTVLCERAASLLPDGDRPALVWSIDLDASGAQAGDAVVERAVVRSRAQLDYPAVQAALDAGTAAEPMVLLREVGLARLAQEEARGGTSLDLAEQEVVYDDGHYRLAYRRPLPVEGWNAQVSLLTGIAAAGLMVAGRVGLLRTLPPPDLRTVDAIRRSAIALGLPVTSASTYPEIVRAADPTTDRGAALLHQAARALRGAGYVVVDAATPVAAQEHAAIASTYAHVTAPLRRLADRFANEVALALCAGRPVPAWATDALPSLPELMGAAHERDGALARAMVDAVEALVLRDRVGEQFDAAVTNVDDRGGVVQLRDPAVLARVDGVTEADLGDEVTVRLDRVDVATRKVTFSLVTSGG
jgi:exoribonuclease R